MLKIKISHNGRQKTVEARAGANLLELLRKEDIYIPAFCGGNGNCGKCLVRIDEGGAGGARAGDEILACKTVLDADCAVTTLKSEKDFQISTAFAGAQSEGAAEISDNVAFAVDVGTTTCVVCALDLSNAKIIGVSAELNKQREFGADVISRIGKCASHLDEMTALIRGQILSGVNELLEKYGIGARKVKKIALVGNTTMMGIFSGIDCTSLGFKPFAVPERIKTGETRAFSELFGGPLDCGVITLPCISAYIGADALASALFCGIRKMGGYNIVADIGTNGEIILHGGDGRLLCASAAAGPALEGGNISCGMGGAAGAVSSVIYENGKFLYKTIGNKKPLGICGSGAIDLTAELIRAGIADETGLLADEWFDNGVTVCENVTFTQDDVRQMQLAKSALRSGLDCLVKTAGITYDDVNGLYLGGGFANGSNVENMANIGLFPKEILNKITLCGNTALGGAVKWLTDKDARRETVEITENAKELELGDNPYFAERFVENMMF